MTIQDFPACIVRALNHKTFMKNARILLLLCCFFAGGALYAQPISQSSYEENLKAARKAYANQDFINALERYETSYEDREEDSLRDTIAWLEFQLRDYRSAERTYRSILRRDKEGTKDQLRFVYGQLLKMNGKYDEAITEFQAFLKTNPSDSLRTLARNEVAGAELALELPENLKGVTVEHAGRDINNKTSEYTPALANQGKTVYFAGFDADDVIYMEPEADGKEAEEPSKKDKKEGGKKEDVNVYAQIFKSNRDDSEWGDREPLGGEVNRPEFHNTNVALSKDGRTMYFTRAKLEGNVLSESKLFFSVEGGGGWQGANELEGVNGDYLAKHPAPGELFGKQVLFFASDMEGGYGGFDLYYATRTGEGQYSDPVNLGEVINGPGDEQTPYYREGTLYFSSSTHPGLGGFDNFYSTWDGTSWSPVLNMGRGYNTSFDDYGFTLDDEGYFGMLASNRPDGTRSAYGRTCCDDLFTVNIARIVVDIVVGTFTVDKKPLTGATVYLVPMKGDKPGEPASQPTGDKSNVVGFDLALETEYMMIGTHPDYYPDTVRLNTVGITESKSVEHRFYLEPKPVPPPEPETEMYEQEEPIVLENILYEFDDDRIQDEAESDLQVVYDLMVEYEDMIIELSSHTDNRGEERYNEDLSQRRAESARRWLVRKGIDRDRIVAKGYGESQPQTVTAIKASRYDFLSEGDVLTSEFIDALETEEQREVAHSYNRRTEFKILEGPKTITIKRIRRIEKPKEGKDRGSLPGAKQKAGKPILKFTEEMYDFGQVRKGEKRKHTFIFYNAGDAPFTIDLISACDCTSFEEDITGETFQPGEKGRLPIIFDSSEKEESETIDIDIFLQETDENGMQLMKTVRYKFELVR
jgi:peptidoglycan-associated lipoprotein